MWWKAAPYVQMVWRECAHAERRELRQDTDKHTGNTNDMTPGSLAAQIPEQQSSAVFRGPERHWRKEKVCVCIYALIGEKQAAQDDLKQRFPCNQENLLQNSNQIFIHDCLSATVCFRKTKL